LLAPALGQIGTVVCRRRCTGTTDCADGDTCTMLNGTDSMACLPPSY